MNLSNLTVKIEKGISLAQLIFGGVKAIVAAMKAGKASVTGPNGEALTAEDVLAAVESAQTATLAIGDAAAGRIGSRHRNFDGSDEE